MNSQKIAILGANGHIGKNLISYFSTSKHNLFLFSRKKKLLSKFIKNFHFANSPKICDYKKFEKFHYDLIINCVGSSDPAEIVKNAHNIQNIAEYYDNKILNYLTKNQKSMYVFFSSGIVYDDEFKNPVKSTGKPAMDINKTKKSDAYKISKINAEIKHRLLSNLNIVDIRIFSFFSKFLNLNSSFLMSDIVNSIKNKITLITNSQNIKRDFVHPRDLFQLIELCMKQKSINCAIDLYSKKPISKFEIIKYFQDKYGLTYKIKKILKNKNKMNYYTTKKFNEFGYKPEFSSLDSIMDESKFFFDYN